MSIFNGNGSEESRHPAKMLMKVADSFRYAFNGLFHVLLTQRNMRFHFCMAIWVMSFSIALRLTGFEKAYLFIVITFVISMETLNTCIEAFTDIVAPTYHEKARIAKDTAAAAVLVVSIGSLMSAGYLMLPPFFTAVADAGWWTIHGREMLAIGVIVVAALGFWGTQVLRWPMILMEAPAGAASSFAICFLGRVGQDWLSFVALQFFSILLFHSLGRKRESVRLAAAVHVAGIAVYAIARVVF
ncbi:MAG: diacylglycerol kinase family protein [bacterium]